MSGGLQWRCEVKANSAPDVNGREIQTIEIPCAALMIAKSAERDGEKKTSVRAGAHVERTARALERAFVPEEGSSTRSTTRA
jgi:hypothetical protein